MAGFINMMKDIWGGQKIATETAGYAGRHTISFHLKERTGRRYLVVRFPGNKYDVIETDQADELLAALKDFRSKL